MIRSMTGYGEAEGSTPVGRLRIELRTVNHRYLNVNTRTPSSLARWENDIREWLRGPFTRGHVNCTVRLEPEEGDGAEPQFQLNDERVTAYLALFRELGIRYGVPGTPDLAVLTRFKDIIERVDPEETAEDFPAERLREVLDEAAAQTVEMREAEGKRLAADLRGRLTAIEQALDEIETMAPGRLTAERDRLREAVQDLLGEIPVDEDRVAREIAMLAERWDINEELVRFRSHLDLFRELLEAESDEPVGKRMSFLVQEMHREANTIGSKANNAPISHRVVAIKEEIERLREQVENVE